MHKHAELSKCGKYRYTLVRTWGKGKHLVFLMVNPSVADHLIDDKTIIRCIGFAKREGYAGIVAINMFAYRATDFEVLKRAYKAKVSVTGPKNFAYLEDVTTQAQLAGSAVVVAWGTLGEWRDADRHMLKHLKRWGVTPMCLGLTQGGLPRHPLMVKLDAPLIPYTVHRPVFPEFADGLA